MGDPVSREKPQLHYAVSVPARAEATGGATWPAGRGQRRVDGIPVSPEVLGRGLVGWRESRASPPSVNCLETRLHLRMGAPTPEAQVPLPCVVDTAFGARGWALRPPRWPGWRNGAPGVQVCPFNLWSDMLQEPE